MSVAWNEDPPLDGLRTACLQKPSECFLRWDTSWIVSSEAMLVKALPTTWSTAGSRTINQVDDATLHPHPVCSCRMSLRSTRVAKTQVCRNTRHPKWDEQHKLLVHDPDIQVNPCIQFGCNGKSKERQSRMQGSPTITGMGICRSGKLHRMIIPATCWGLRYLSPRDAHFRHIFVHGVKDNYFRRTSSGLSGVGKELDCSPNSQNVLGPIPTKWRDNWLQELKVLLFDHDLLNEGVL